MFAFYCNDFNDFIPMTTFASSSDADRNYGSHKPVTKFFEAGYIPRDVFYSRKQDKVTNCPAYGRFKEPVDASARTQIVISPPGDMTTPITHTTYAPAQRLLGNTAFKQAGYRMLKLSRFRKPTAKTAFIDGVIGSRMTGAGFGGCTVSIVKDEAIDTFIDKVGAAYKEKIGYAADFYVVEIGDGPAAL